MFGDEIKWQISLVDTVETTVNGKVVHETVRDQEIPIQYTAIPPQIEQVGGVASTAHHVSGGEIMRRG